MHKFAIMNTIVERLKSTHFLNPFMLNLFSHPYQLDKSISNFRVVGWVFSFLFKF